MTEVIDHRGARRIPYLLLAASGLVRFINLGFLDLQAWDEALYAVRAETISKFGLFFDQSARAVDGLYSALHPPLYVWLTALSYAVFGVNEFAARFFSALAGSLTLFVIYRIGVLLKSERAGLIAALLYGLAPVTLFYSRQGQFDATLVLFISLAFCCLIQAICERSSRHAFASGLATGAALMTKLFVGFGLPLTFFVWMASSRRLRSRADWRLFGWICLGMLLVAAPWHAFMTVRHGQGEIFFFLEASSLVQRTLTGVEGNVKPLGVLYFVNQMFVLFPFGVFWMLHALRGSGRRADPLWHLIALWFAVFFVVFSMMRTQLEVYILPMLGAASLLAGRSIASVRRAELGGKVLVALLAATAIAVTWSASQHWRDAAKSVLGALASLTLPDSSELQLVTHLGAVVVAILIVATIFWNRAGTPSLSRIVAPMHLVPLALFAFLSVAYLDQTRYLDGGFALARFISDRGIRHVVVAGYERNPQLSYYLGGADIGWDGALEFERIVPPPDELEFKTWLARELADVPAGALVVLEKDKFVRYRWIDPQRIMPQSFIVAFESRRYSAWMRRADDTLAGRAGTKASSLTF